MTYDLAKKLLELFEKEGGVGMMTTLLGQKIETGKKYVFLKEIGTGSSTRRKVKMIGVCQKQTGRLHFLCEWAEGYSWPVGETYSILDPKNVICEFTPMTPLTADELKAMNGKPVWCKRNCQWFIVELNHPDFGECVINSSGYYIPLKKAGERDFYAHEFEY